MTDKEKIIEKYKGLMEGMEEGTFEYNILKAEKEHALKTIGQNFDRNDDVSCVGCSG
jgi:hypothetical protein